MSNYLYILPSAPGWHKPGIRISPYSAVRHYQRDRVETIGLVALYFGRERHIKLIEELIKEKYEDVSGDALTGRGQRELFKVSLSDLVETIDQIINDHELHVEKIHLETPYTASKSSDCPLGCESEKFVTSQSARRIEKKWGKDPQIERFEQLFECL